MVFGCFLMLGLGPSPFQQVDPSMQSTRGGCEAMELRLEPDWGALQPGDLVSFVGRVEVSSASGGKALLRTALRGRCLMINMAIDDHGGTIAVMQGRVQETKPGMKLDVSSAYIVRHMPPTDQSWQQVTEICAGIGGMMGGFEANGITHAAGNDIRASFTSYQQGRGRVMLTGDIGDAKIQTTLAGLAGSATWLAAGFPCQPWSKLGDGKGTMDERAKTLPAILEFAFWTRPTAMVLECVVEAGRDPLVQQMLQEWAKHAGYHYVHQELRLEHLWPNRRERWWALLYPLALPKIYLQPLPIHKSRAVLADLLPVMPVWPETHLQELRLGATEKKLYIECGTLKQCLLQPEEPVRTLLHGFANQLAPCACGCRAYPLSAERLRQRGIYGALVIMSTPGEYTEVAEAEVRHMHPWEMALVAGMNPSQPWEVDIRLSIAGIGQLASPIQAAWIVAQLRYSLSDIAMGEHVDSPEHVLWNHLNHLWSERDNLLPALRDHARTNHFKERCYQLLKGHQQARSPHRSPTLTPPKIEAIKDKPRPRPSQAPNLPREIHAPRADAKDTEPTRHEEPEKDPIEDDHPTTAEEEKATGSTDTKTSQPQEGFANTKTYTPPGQTQEVKRICDAFHRWEQNKRRKETTPPTQIDNTEDDQKTAATPLHLIPVAERQVTRLTCIHLPGIHDENGTSLIYAREAEHAPGATVGELVHQETDWCALTQPIRATNVIGIVLDRNDPVARDMEIILSEQAKYQDPTCPRQGGTSARRTTPHSVKGLTREEAARLQQAWVADDEMEYYLQEIEKGTSMQTWEVLTDQKDALGWLLAQIHTLDETQMIASAVLVGQH